LLSSLTFDTTPVPGSHESSVQGLPSSIVFGLPPVHVPLTQLSVCVHASLSEQLFASLLSFDTTPVPGSHESSVHGLPSSIVFGLPPVHVPLTQLSVCVHASLSEQVLPSSS
jgi:hypothetical protein